MSSTLPAGVAAFPFANIMPTAALAVTAKFVMSESVAADVFVATAAAYSMLDVTTTAMAEPAHLPILLQQRQWPLISLSLLILRHHLPRPQRLQNLLRRQ
jgi:hypothetical protein